MEGRGQSMLGKGGVGQSGPGDLSTETRTKGMAQRRG